MLTQSSNQRGSLHQIIYLDIFDDSIFCRWWEVRLPLDQLKEELSPRISLEDVLMYKHSSVLIDVRRPEVAYYFFS